MKQTLITLLAFCGVAMADTLTLTQHDVMYGTSSTLPSSNASMTWGDTETYTNWYMEFSLSGLIVDPSTTAKTDTWSDTICTDGSTDRQGLSVLVTVSDGDDEDNAKGDGDWLLTFGKGGRTAINSETTLTFDTSDILTFAVYNGVAYIGNKTDEAFISVSLDGVTFNEGAGSAMTSGDARAFANNNSNSVGTTPIDKTTIASLDNLGIPAGQELNIVKLVTTGEAVTIPEPTTATLSLLALCGLAARRRRR